MRNRESLKKEINRKREEKKFDGGWQMGVGVLRGKKR